jgi:alpha-ketoglutarate-dependent taurine dioxygenase
MVQDETPLADSIFAYKSEDLTLHIGARFPDPDLQLARIPDSPHADKLYKELAKLISERGVVFFKNQTITPAELKVLGQRIGEGGGKPKTSGLHRHPISREEDPLGGEVSIITSEGYLPNV